MNNAQEQLKAPLLSRQSYALTRAAKAYCELLGTSLPDLCC